MSADVDGIPPPPELLWKKHLALLVYLAVSPRRARSRDHLIGLFWGDKAEAAARHSLNEAVRVIRRHLGEDAIATGGPQVTLSPQAVVLDDSDGGVFLEGFSIAGCAELEEWLAAERLIRQRTGVDALTAQAEASVAAGDTTSAIRHAEQAVALAPSAEPATRSLMRALALGGHSGLAVTAFEALVGRLAELGLEPDTETTALRDRIRRGQMRRGRPLNVASGGRDRVPLRGRSRELSALVAATRAAAAARQAAVFIVEGESGSGKTRVLEEVAERARLDGMTVALARSMPAEADRTWTAIGGLGRGGLMDAPGIVGARPDALAAVARSDPDWTARLGRTGDEPLDRALVEVIRAVADETPLLLVLDDAQWADAASLGALAAVARDAAQCPIVLLLATRGVPESETLENLRAHIGRDIRGEYIKIGPLEESDLASLAEALLPRLAAEDRGRLVRRIAVDSGGLPMLATEMLRAVAHGLDLGRLSRPWPEAGRTLDDTSPAELPDAVVASVRVNYRRLSPDAQTALAAAAVLEDRVGESRIGTASGLPRDRLTAALDELEWERWLVADGRGYAFRARLIREIISRDFLTAGQRDRIRRHAESQGAAATT